MKRKIIGRLFSDEPPPLDRVDDVFGNTSNQRDLFAADGDIFSDLNDDEPFFGDKRYVSDGNRSDGKPFELCSQVFMIVLCTRRKTSP